MPGTYRNDSLFALLQIVTRLRTKLTAAFYLTGKKRITPICPLKMAFDYNPTSAYYSYAEGAKNCSYLAVVRIPFFLDRLGPKYEEVTVMGHESTPGHHLEVIIKISVSERVKGGRWNKAYMQQRGGCVKLECCPPPILPKNDEVSRGYFSLQEQPLRQIFTAK